MGDVECRGWIVAWRAVVTALVLVGCQDPLPSDPARDPDQADGELCAAGGVSDMSCKGVVVLSMLNAADFGATFVNDVWGWTDFVTNTEWALVGHADGTSFINLKDPGNPVYAGILPLTPGTDRSIWRDIKVYRGYAYIVADGAGDHRMQVFDLSRLRDAADPPMTFDATTLYTNIGGAHNLAINEETGFAYSVGSNGKDGETCGGALHMIDIREPASPSFAGCFRDTRTGMMGGGYTHDAMCIVYRGPDEEHQGREVCFGSNETALQIADVTDKSAPVALSYATYPNVGYAHQGWIDAAHEYFYMNDEMDEMNTQPTTRTLVWDVKDLDDPVMVREVMSETRATDHNLYVVGDMMYQSNYTAGLRILDISDRMNPVEVAYLDTTPEQDGTGTSHGSWSNYPFFASGVIVVTSIGEGVFFVKRAPGG